MTCAELQTQFDDRLDGCLGGPAMAAFDAHLIGCETCRRDWRDYTGAWQGLAQHQVSGPSVGFAERTLRRLAEEQRRPARRLALIPGLRWALGSLAALTIVGLTWLNVQHVKTERRVRLYSAVSATEQVEDLDVIVYLHELGDEDEL